MTEISVAQIWKIVANMSAAGFEVEVAERADDVVAFTCPSRSRPMFGAVIADVLGGIPAARGMLLAARTEHDRETQQVALYFPGYTVGG